MNILILCGLYIAAYAAFSAIGAALLFAIRAKPNAYLLSLAPLLGLSLFGAAANMLMFVYTGEAAGFTCIAVLGAAALAVLAIRRRAAMLSYRDQPPLLWVGFAGGLLFLLPLLLTNDLGIFALNGADFGSYAGWGSFFQDHTLLDGRPASVPLNSTMAGFANLQEELARPESAWRVGNISLFAGLAALVPAALWPAFYMAVIGLVFGQFAVAASYFTRAALLQSRSLAVKVGWLTLLLNTVTWLAMSHYTPNIVGLALTLALLGLLLDVSAQVALKVIVATSFAALLIVVYPESLLFITALLPALAGYRYLLIARRRRIKRLLRVALPATAALLLALIASWRSVPTVARHLKGIAGYDRPGDFVGIFNWSYPSQLFGFADYNSVLTQYDSLLVKTLVVLGYLCVVLILGLQLAAVRQDERHHTRVRRAAIWSLLLALCLFGIPIVNYGLREQWLLVWRSSLTLSPYIWIIVMLFGLQAFRDRRQMGAARRSIASRLQIVAFVALLAIAILFRLFMLKAVMFGSDHGAIFGKAIAKQIAALEGQAYDYVFIDYEGTGTIQGGWEFYSQNLPFIFPEHGSGRNEYTAAILNGKKIAVIGGGFTPVQRLVGFGPAAAGQDGVRLSDRDAILLPYSSTWTYMKHGPILLLPGLPGKLLFWVQQDSTACLNIKAHANRPNADLRIAINGGNPETFDLDARQPIELCAGYHKGLNVIRLEPLDQTGDTLRDRAALMQTIANRPAETLTETELGLKGIYLDGFSEKDPLSSARSADWGQRWNLLTPDDKPPFNPHVIFEEITLRKRE